MPPLPANSISIPTFSPRVAIVVDILSIDSRETLIATESPHTFVIGQSVKIIIPPPARATMTNPAYDYGMPEINNMILTITDITSGGPDQFFVALDSRFFEPFTEQFNATQLAQAVPVGELNSHLDGAWRNILRPA